MCKGDLALPHVFRSASSREDESTIVLITFVEPPSKFQLKTDPEK